MTEKEKLQFVEKVVSPFSVDQLLRMATMKKWKDSMFSEKDEEHVEELCRKLATQNGYEEKDLQLAFQYVKELAGNELTINK